MAHPQSRSLPLSALPWRALQLLALGLLSTAASVRAQEAPHEIVDDDYKFKLVRPHRGWTLMDEEAIQKITPAAVAGAIAGDGRALVFVVVERLPGATLKLFEQQTRQNLEIEDRQDSASETLKFVGVDAMRFHTRGSVDGNSLDYRFTMFLRGDFAYQVVMMSAADQSSIETLDSWTDKAFSLVPGEPRERVLDTNVRDQNGVGWLVRDAVFSDAPSRIRVTPDSGWRLSVGYEAKTLMNGSYVGVTRSNPTMTLAVVTEHSGEDFATYRARQLAEWAGELEVTDSRVVIGGEDVEAWTYVRDETLELRYQLAVFERNGIRYQAVAFYAESVAAEAQPHLQSAWNCLSFLDEDETRAVREELAALSAHDAIGADYVVRDRRFLDFANDVQITLPAEAYWQVEIEDDARAYDSECKIALRSREHGVTGAFIVMDVASAEEIHAQQLSAWSAPESVETEDVVLERSKVVARSTEWGTDNQRVWVVTAYAHGKGYSFEFQGHPTMMARAADAIDRLLAGTTFEDLPARVESDDGIVDNRLGYEFRLEGIGKPTNLDNAATSPSSTTQSWKVDSCDVTVSVVPLQGSADPAWGSTRLEQALDNLGFDNKSSSESTLAGRPARAVQWSKRRFFRSNNINAFFIVRGDTAYALMIDGNPGEDGIERYKNAFRLLD